MVTVQVDFSRISDSPYCPSNKRTIFVFDTDKIKAFIQDLVNGNPTCYLISGYRGSGKTSFIEKIKEELSKPIEAIGPELIFVTSNFSRYESETYVLRRLIRNIYLEINQRLLSKRKDTVQAVQKKLELIYRRTFEDISTQEISYNKYENESSSDINWSCCSGFVFARCGRWSGFKNPVLLSIGFLIQ